MPSTIATANTIIELSSNRGIKLYPSKLQMLIYYSQAWYLKLNNKPLVDDYFVRHKAGPIIWSLYHKLKYINSYIPSKIISAESHDAHKYVELVTYTLTNDYIVSFLNKILDVYGGFSDSQLINMATQNDYIADNSPISLDEMKQEVE